MNLNKIQPKTPIVEYPRIINDNFSMTKNIIENFYIPNEKIKEYKSIFNSNEIKGIRQRQFDKGIIVAPVNNSSVTSDLGTFNLMNCDVLNVNTLHASKLPGYIRYKNLNTDHFTWDDDDGIISINDDLFPEEYKHCALLWGDNKNNILLGDVAKSTDIEIKDNKNNVYDTIIIGDESCNEVSTGSNNIIMGSAVLSNVDTMFNNVILSNDFNAEKEGTFKNNIILGTTQKAKISDNGTYENMFSVGFNTMQYLYGDMLKCELNLQKPLLGQASFKFGQDIYISSNNDSLLVNQKENNNINIIVGHNQLSGVFAAATTNNIIIGSNNTTTHKEGSNNIIIGSNNTDMYDLAGMASNDNMLCIGNNDDPYITGGIDDIAKDKFTMIHGNINMPDIGFNASGTVLGIDHLGNVVRLVSSEKYKYDIQTLDNADVIYKMRPVTYKDKSEVSDKTYYGFIAEELAEIDERLVSYKINNGKKEIDSVSYERMVVLLVAEMQSYKKRIAHLEEKLKNK